MVMGLALDGKGCDRTRLAAPDRALRKASVTLAKQNELAGTALTRCVVYGGEQFATELFAIGANE